MSAFLLWVLGIFVAVQARQLAYWTANAPGPGFLPFWLGVLLSCAAAVLFLRAWFGGGIGPPSPFPARPMAVRLAGVVALTAAAAVLIPYVGLVLAVGAFVAAMLVYLRPGHARANWTTAVATAAVVWLIFVRWLGVPVPRGPLGF